MRLLSDLIDIIYPPRCHICMDFLDDRPVERGDICNTCFSGFRELSHPYCSICGEPFKSKVEEDHLCERCLRKRPFYDELRSPYLYEETIKDAIQLIKYSGRSNILKSLGLLLGAFARNWIGNTKGMIMMPVPLHRKKLRERGFNQSAMIAKSASPILETETDFFTLIRTRYTNSQTGLNPEERIKNVRGAFEVSPRTDLEGKTVILIDDVATTGSTLNECARVLKKEGCERVLGLVLARTAAYKI